MQQEVVVDAARTGHGMRIRGRQYQKGECAGGTAKLVTAVGELTG
jgi:hypothetical protein